jgi:DNA-binding transcriptional MerR regulator
MESWIMSDDLSRPERSYTIRQLCLEFSVTPRSLRFYEDKGLLFPARHGLNRVYSARDRARLILILRGKRVGFSLLEIGEMLDLYDKDETHAAQLEVSVKKFRERIAALETQRIELARAIDGLKHACTRAETMLSRLDPERPPRAEDYHNALSKPLSDHAA